MQRTTGNIIADSLESAVSYADRLVQEISHLEAARFARPGGQPVSSNHPCFTFGHLSLYPSKVLSQLDQDSLPIPAGFEKLFDKTATCKDDPNHTIYPSFDEVLTFFSASHKKLLKHCASLQMRPLSDQIQLKGHSPHDFRHSHQCMRFIVVATSCHTLANFPPGVACRACRQPDSHSWQNEQAPSWTTRAPKNTCTPADHAT